MRLEGFVDWVDPISNKTDEDREDDMFSLTTGFAARMRKRVARTQGEITLGSEVPGDKHLKRSDLNDEV